MCTFSADHCIYMHNTPSGSSIIAIHIDDMAATASNRMDPSSKNNPGKFLASWPWRAQMATGVLWPQLHTHTISLCQATYIESSTKSTPRRCPSGSYTAGFHSHSFESHGPKDEEGNLDEENPIPHCNWLHHVCQPPLILTFICGTTSQPV